MLQPVNPDEELIAARLLEFFSAATPWHRGLWNPGLALTLKELLEASLAVRSSVLHDDTLKVLGSTCLRLSGLDPGAGSEARVQALHQCLRSPLRYEGLDYYSLRDLANEIEAQYLQRWADALRRTAGRPKAERAARSMAAHLLDLGFSPGFLHRWWKFRLEYEGQSKSLADMVEEAHTMARRRHQAYEALIVLLSSPRSKSGYPPDWLNSSMISQWLKSHSFGTSDLRPAGGLKLAVVAPDAEAAAELAGERVDSLLARAAVATGEKIDVVQKVWIAGEKKPFSMVRRLRGVRVRALYREDRIYPMATPDGIFGAAIELLSNLESSSPSAAVAGGWAAIEALLSEADDRGGAAERLAALVACSFPRAELTVLSYLLEKAEPSLAGAFAACGENRDRARLVARAIRSPGGPTLKASSDRAALERMNKLLRQPRKTLEDIKLYAADAFTRLYRQRNLVLHWGKTDAVALRASLRTAAPLVGAGMDRIAHGWYVNHLRPIELAARARVGLSTIPDDDIDACISLLD